jgi:nucleotide-binding universal stress UspA family protein
MYRSLLVPLDRSSRAEHALPLALGIARRANARLDLAEVHALYALEPARAGRALFDRELDDEQKRQERLYLDATAKWLGAASPVPVTTSVLAGSAALPLTVADSILTRARACRADLIVAATHGRGPLTRIVFGSVADELLRRAPMPVLLVRPGPTAASLLPEPVLDNILVPLDGSALAEQVLGPALDLARLMEARCSLLRVVEPRGGSSERARAGAYLDDVAARASAQGLPVRTRVVAARHAAEVILEEAAVESSDLIALVTHARGGLSRLLWGSVADKLVRCAASPVLVCRPC